jgi:hypothetical protein
MRLTSATIMRARPAYCAQLPVGQRARPDAIAEGPACASQVRGSTGRADRAFEADDDLSIETAAVGFGLLLQAPVEDRAGP